MSAGHSVTLAAAVAAEDAVAVVVGAGSGGKRSPVQASE